MLSIDLNDEDEANKLVEKCMQDGLLLFFFCLIILQLEYLLHLQSVLMRLKKVVI